MSTFALTVTVGYRWWVWPYVNTLIFICLSLYIYPDIDKLGKIIEKGLYIIDTKMVKS